MDLRLAGRTGVITGASHGIGLATAQTLTAEGMRILGAARSTSDAFDATGAEYFAVDLATPDGPVRLADHAMTVLGAVDVLVNCVGGAERFIALDDLTDADWMQALHWNLMSAVRLTHQLRATLIDRCGAVINVSSGAARHPSSSPMPYAAAKAALTNWSKGLAEQLGPLGVRVNTVSPGMIATRVWCGPDGVGAQLAALAGQTQNEFLATAPERGGITIGRLIEPHEVADQIAWLASPRSSAICGADIIVDGGFIKTT